MKHYSVSYGNCDRFFYNILSDSAPTLCPVNVRYDFIYNNSPMDYYYAPCVTVYSDRGGSGVCPLGWGTYDSYASYKTGCYQCRHYPSPVSESYGPSLDIGSAN